MSGWGPSESEWRTLFTVFALFFAAIGGAVVGLLVWIF